MKPYRHNFIRSFFTSVIILLLISGQAGYAQGSRALGSLVKAGKNITHIISKPNPVSSGGMHDIDELFRVVAKSNNVAATPSMISYINSTRSSGFNIIWDARNLTFSSVPQTYRPVEMDLYRVGSGRTQNNGANGGNGNNRGYRSSSSSGPIRYDPESYNSHMNQFIQAACVVHRNLCDSLIVDLGQSKASSPTTISLAVPECLISKTVPAFTVSPSSGFGSTHPGPDCSELFPDLQLQSANTVSRPIFRYRSAPRRHTRVEALTPISLADYEYLIPKAELQTVCQSQPVNIGRK